MNAWKFMTSFAFPACTLIALMSASGIPLESGAAYAILGGFMLVKITLELLVVERALVPYIRAGREVEARACVTLGFSALGLAVLALFLVMTR